VSNVCDKVKINFSRRYLELNKDKWLELKDCMRKFENIYKEFNKKDSSLQIYSGIYWGVAMANNVHGDYYVNDAMIKTHSDNHEVINSLIRILNVFDMKDEYGLNNIIAKNR
jgi:hypothetical protein